MLYVVSTSRPRGLFFLRSIFEVDRDLVGTRGITKKLVPPVLYVARVNHGIDYCAEDPIEKCEARDPHRPGEDGFLRKKN